MALLCAAAVIAFLPTHAYAAGPALSIPAGPYTDGQTISISGTGFPTRTADPSGLQILECADPGGTTANLPTDNTTCDGSTINALPVLTDSSGNFTASYSVLVLPPAGGNSAIDCDLSHYCVIWAGVDETQFLSNSAFSAPFLFTTSSGTTTTTGATTTTTSGATTTTTEGATTTTTGATTTTTSAGTTTTTTSAGTTTTTTSAGGTTTTTTAGGTTTTSGGATTTTTSAGSSTTSPATGAGGGTASGGTGTGSVGASSGQLAFTGPPTVLPWLIGFGVILTVLGGMGRRLLPRRTP